MALFCGGDFDGHGGFGAGRERGRDGDFPKRSGKVAGVVAVLELRFRMGAVHDSVHLYDTLHLGGVIECRLRIILRSDFPESPLLRSAATDAHGGVVICGRAHLLRDVGGVLLRHVLRRERLAGLQVDDFHASIVLDDFHLHHARLYRGDGLRLARGENRGLHLLRTHAGKRNRRLHLHFAGVREGGLFLVFEDCIQVKGESRACSKSKLTTNISTIFFTSI